MTTGYRASIRRQLRRYLQSRSISLPDWLEDRCARFSVMQFKDASFDYIQSVKEEEKKRRQPRVPPVPEETVPTTVPNAGVTMLSSNSLAPAAAWSGVILST